MANSTADYGFSYVRSHLGEPKMIECAVLSAGSDLFVGDPVKLSGTGDSQSRPSITVAAAGDTNIFGVVQGIKATGSDGLNKMHSDSADTVMVMPVGPGVVFRVNGPGGGANEASLNDIGLRFNHKAANGDTKTGRSNYYLDMGETTGGLDNTNQWLLIGFDRRADNTFSTTVSTDTSDVDCLVVCMEATFYTGGTGA